MRQGQEQLWPVLGTGSSVVLTQLTLADALHLTQLRQATALGILQASSDTIEVMGPPDSALPALATPFPEVSACLSLAVGPTGLPAASPVGTGLG